MASPSKKKQKREDYIDWDEYFMGLALLSAKRSKDPDYQVGACIVNEDKKIVGVGYNGMPIGCHDDNFPWGKGEYLYNKHLYVCHAELNAIINRYSANLKGCTIYTSLFPCNECAKLIIQSGIKNVVYLSDDKADKKKFKAALIMFEAVDISRRQFIPKRKLVVFDCTNDD